jgi:hypothetical protein
MNWIKKGLIFNSNGVKKWAVEGAMIPTPVHLNKDVLRVFLTFLDNKGIGRTGYVDLAKNNLNKVLKVSPNPVFDIGAPGTFDENGSLTCSVVKVPDFGYYFYYAGFELGTQIRYRLLTGLAITNDNFELKKKFKTPVLERIDEELHFRCGPFCMLDNGIFKMWYVAGSEWTEIDGKSMPVYEIKYLESVDGINWRGAGSSCIKIEKENEHGFGRPYVIKHNGLYKMFYSVRVKKLGYRLGYAESVNGLHWVRKDNEMNLNVSEDGFDNEMICYSSVIEINGKLIMFYNGNDFGKTGFGYAELVNDKNA